MGRGGGGGAAAGAGASRARRRVCDGWSGHERAIRSHSIPYNYIGVYRGACRECVCEERAASLVGHRPSLTRSVTFTPPEASRAPISTTAACRRRRHECATGSAHLYSHRGFGSERRVEGPASTRGTVPCQLQGGGARRGRHVVRGQGGGRARRGRRARAARALQRLEGAVRRVDRRVQRQAAGCGRRRDGPEQAHGDIRTGCSRRERSRRE